MYLPASCSCCASKEKGVGILTMQSNSLLFLTKIKLRCHLLSKGLSAPFMYIAYMKDIG